MHYVLFMPKPGQLALFARSELAKLSPVAHGGDIGKGRHKGRRPFSPRRPLHIVMRSSRARGPWSLLSRSNRDVVGALLRRLATENAVQVYQFANVGNHLHLLAVCRERRAFQRFLRTFAGLIARAVTGAQRGRPAGKFWDTLAYSRVITWGREYRCVRAYILNNEFEAGGLPTDRTRRLARKRTNQRTSPAGIPPVGAVPSPAHCSSSKPSRPPRESRGLPALGASSGRDPRLARSGGRGGAVTA